MAETVAKSAWPTGRQLNSVPGLIMNMRISLHQGEAPIEMAEVPELDAPVRSATEEARSIRLLTIILLEADSGNRLSSVVGGDETTPHFVHHHKVPPSYRSKAAEVNEDPVLTTYVAHQHHAEIPTNRVIRMEQGVSPAREFLDTGELPTCIESAEARGLATR